MVPVWLCPGRRERGDTTPGSEGLGAVHRCSGIGAESVQPRNVSRQPGAVVTSMQERDEYGPVRCESNALSLENVRQQPPCLPPRQWDVPNVAPHSGHVARLTRAPRRVRRLH